MRLAVRPPNSKFKDFAIHISEIELTTGKTLTVPEVIRASPHGLAEGSHIIKRGTFYYLFTAEGGTESGHHEVVLRSTNGPLGPWTVGPSLGYNGTDEEVQNTGHADVFESADGEWWAVLLGVRPQKLNGQWKESPLGTSLSSMKNSSLLIVSRPRDVPCPSHLERRLASFQSWQEYQSFDRRKRWANSPKAKFHVEGRPFGNKTRARLVHKT